MSPSESNGSSRMERKKSRTRQKIVQAALPLFQQQGFDATSMEQIAEQADIAKGTLYNYFPVKEAILSEHVQRTFQEKHADRIQRLRQLPDTRARLSLILEELVRGIQAQKEIFERFFAYRVQNIVSLRKTPEERSGFELLATEIILLGQKSGELRSDLPISLMEDQVEFVFVEVAKQFYLQPDTFNAADVIAACVDLFMNGVTKGVNIQ
jgi:AcrR family transcriptional regulator